jgi:hypothetical protein
MRGARAASVALGAALLALGFASSAFPPSFCLFPAVSDPAAPAPDCGVHCRAGDTLEVGIYAGSPDATVEVQCGGAAAACTTGASARCAATSSQPVQFDDTEPCTSHATAAAGVQCFAVGSGPTGAAPF